MSNGVTEIIEETKTQLEIIETGSGQIEIVDQGNNSIEISFSGSAISPDLDISTTTTTEIVTIDNISENTIINVKENPPLNVEITSETTTLEITERILLSGSFDLTFNNLIDNPFSIADDGKVARGLSVPEYDFHVNGTLFSDVLSSSKVETPRVDTNRININSDGVNNIIKITSQSRTPVMINPAGVITLDDFQYTPPAVAGGLLYSGSEFYLGLE
jgi:hypothetical protein